MRQESRRLFGLRPLRSRGLWKGKVLKNVKVSTVPSAPWRALVRFSAMGKTGRAKVADVKVANSVRARRSGEHAVVVLEFGSPMGAWGGQDQRSKNISRVLSREWLGPSSG